VEDAAIRPRRRTIDRHYQSLKAAIANIGDHFNRHQSRQNGIRRHTKFEGDMVSADLLELRREAIENSLLACCSEIECNIAS